MHETTYPDVFPGAVVDRNGRFETELNGLPEPDEPRVDRASSLPATATIQAGLEWELDERDHAVKRCPQSHIFHKCLQILQVILYGEALAQPDRIVLDLLLDR